jgi:hypothetical protein
MLPVMTVRRWMLAVAVIALAIAPVEFGRRWYVYTNKAESCERRAEGASIRRKSDDRFGIFGPELFDADGWMKPEHAALYELLREYFEAQGRKYRYAAAHPWEAVESDPPIWPVNKWRATGRGRPGR